MKLGLALSGGGIRGVAHVGLLQAFEENNIPISVIGGTSSGSMVAALYAMGYTPAHMYVLFKKYAREIANVNLKPFKTGISSALNRSNDRKAIITGLKSGKELEDIMNVIANRRGYNKLTDIKIPIVIPTVDMVEKKEYIFTNYIPVGEEKNSKYIRDITIGKAVRASSSFPAAFSPCNINKCAFMDGGLVNSVPANEVKKQGADKVISVRFESDPIDKNSDLMDILITVLDIIGSQVSENSIKMSDLIINIYTDRVGLLDFKKIDKCYKYGYMIGLKNIEKVKKLF